jgi:hypothetical protein
VRGIFFDEDDARAAAAQLRADGFAAEVAREALAGEDDDEDHPWAVTTDAPEVRARPRPVLDLPTAPRRHHRPPGPGRPPV